MASDILSGFQTIISVTAAPETVSLQQERLQHGGRVCHEKEVYIMVADIIMEWKARKDS